MVRFVDVKRKGTRTLRFKNVAKDFGIDMVYFKKLPSGNLKVGEPVGYKGKTITVVPRVAKKTDSGYRFSQGGSPFNTYYHKGTV